MRELAKLVGFDGNDKEWTQESRLPALLRCLNDP